MLFRSAFFALGFLAFSQAPAAAQQIDSAARNAILIDTSSGAVLMSKDPDQAVPPASMLKLMTVNMVFEALASGRLKMEDEFVVSEKAWKTGGSKMFVKVKERISIENLLRGIIVQSGNDACIVVAEGLAGSETEFARRMTKRGQELGLEHSVFENATGLPAEGQRMSVRDLAILSERLITEFPEYYKIFNEKSFTWEGIDQRNRNPLLRNGDMGADGLKTGYTEAAGYGIAGSAKQGDRRLVVVLAGLPSSQARAVEAERILKWGFREFETTKLLSAGATLGKAEVWIGETDKVALVADKPLYVTTAFGQSDEIKAEIRYAGPLQAPITKGDQVATLRVKAPNVDPIDVPLLAGADVAKGGFQVKMKSAATMALEKGLALVLGRPGEPATE